MASALINLSNNVCVSIIETENVPQLQILSGSQGLNKINLIRDIGLWRLSLLGDADLEISHLERSERSCSGFFCL